MSNAHIMESLFGPPSEPIDVAAFICAATNATEPASHFVHANANTDIAVQCSVADLQNSLSETWNNPTLSAHLSKTHEYTVTSLHAATKPVTTKRRTHLPDPETLPPEVTALQRNLDNIKLSSWKLQTGSALFMRSSKNSDHNVLTRVKLAREPSYSLSDNFQAIITVTIYNRLTWSPSYVTRTSQHALLSSQTLGDLFNVIPCISNEFMADGPIDNHTSERDRAEPVNNNGCVICIEGIVYGDGLTEEDYADKLIKHLQTVSKDAPSITKAIKTIHNTPISSLCLRINEPYWLLHQGNCEHFVVINQIRLQHPSDVSSGYPLTLQITPPLLDLCRACVKVPAVLSIIGDVRVGESPFLICTPCWRNMGDPPDPGVIVRSLPKYEFGL